MFQNLSTPDLITLLLYFTLLLGIGFHYSRKEKCSTDYFLAGKNVGWVAIGASLFVTTISSGHFFGLAGLGSSSGLVIGQLEWLSVIFVLILGWVIAPMYIKSGVATVPEFWEKRFNKSSRMYLTGISIVAYIFIKISIILYAGGLLLKEILGLDMAVSAIILIAFAGIYAVTGGLKAIVHVDILQTIVLISGTLALAIFGLNAIGGISGIQAKVPAEFYCMFKPVSDPNFPWTGVIFGLPILGIWYWFTDQYVVQRALGGKDENHVRSGTILAGFLKVIMIFILVLPGIIAYIYFRDPLIGDRALPALISSNLLPSGVKGIVIASLLAALISALASSFNSSSALFTMDFYRQFRPDSTEKELVLVGRLATVAVVFLGIFWVPFLRYISSHVYIYFLKAQAYISPPVAAVFLVGLLWKRVNGAGAIWALSLGAAMSLIRFILELLTTIGNVSVAPFQFIVEWNFLHFAVFLFLLSGSVLIIVSLLTEKTLQKKLPGLTLAATATLQSGTVQSNVTNETYWTKVNIGLSIFLLAAVFAFYIIFS